MRTVLTILGERHPCAYLPEREALLEYYVTAEMSPQNYEDLMNQGHRKFGRMLFQPVCDSCRECRPLRVPVAEFQPNRSQRRAWTKNRHLQVRYAHPFLDDERLELYRSYHAAQAERKGWPDYERDEATYEMNFLHSPIPAVEISLWEAGKLRAVVITDVTPNTVSGVYHFYDPELYAQSIGTYCVLLTIDLARKLERRYAYFGFYVAGCGSLAYKARFEPCEIMSAAGEWSLSHQSA